MQVIQQEKAAAARKAEPDLVSLQTPKPRNLVLPQEKALMYIVGDVFAFGTTEGNHRTGLS